MKNLKAFNELIERYETITLGEIKWEFDYFEDHHASDFVEDFAYQDAKIRLTGFSHVDKCILCKEAKLLNEDMNFCYQCLWGNNYACIHGKHWPSYSRIKNASTPLKLFNAYRARAKYMRKHLKTLQDEKTNS